jgi:predicted esterase
MQFAREQIREERRVFGGRRLTVDFEWAGAHVPGILLLPEPEHPAPAALLLHGYSLDKQRMADTAGVALLAHRIASLSLDLPLHGERFESFDPSSARNPFELMRRWRAAIGESASALGYLGARADVDATRLALVGYSLGAYLALAVAAEQPALRAVVLASGGDLPSYTPFEKFVRMAANPLKLVRRLAGRPLLMLNGRFDRTITPAEAQRLFDSAKEPKHLQWWDSGHILPDSAIAHAAGWLAATLTAPDARKV